MTTRSILRGTKLACLVLLMAPVRSFATMETGDADGNPPNPTPQSTAEIEWNPRISCTVQPGDGIYDLLRCLAAGIDPTFPCPGNAGYPDSTSGGSGGPGYVHIAADPPSSTTVCPHEREDYEVWWLPSPRVGIQIHRLDGSEVDDISLKENDPAIAWTKLEVNRPGLVARIGRVQGIPSDEKSISITVNDRAPVEVRTDRSMTMDGVTFALGSHLQMAGFSVTYEPAYILVSWDNQNGTGITKVSFRSTDPGITKSELRLEPLSGSARMTMVGPARTE